MMKEMMLNIIGLLAAVAIFSGSFAYAASSVQQVKEQTAPANTVVQIDDDLLQHEIGIGDLLPNLSSEPSGNIISSNKSSSEASSQNASSKPSSVASSSKPNSSKPPSSEPPSSEPPFSEPSSTPSSDIPDNEIDNEMLMVISGAVQREIVGTNTAPSAKYYEAYKAQAVACQSYMEYHRSRTGSYPTMSYATPHSKTVELVASVLNLKMYSNGQAINASYHAASGGYTQSASYVWGGAISYLQAAISSYDDYQSNYTISIAEAESKLLAYGISVSGDSSTWFDLANATLTDGGFIHTINICGTVVTGRKLRENIFGASSLKSCKITDISVDGNHIVFSTKGYGHGAGMSQLGALGYAANEGWSYIQILEHYYTGITIK